LDQFSVTVTGADPGAQQLQATMISFLTARYRAEYPNEFVDVNLSVNQDSVFVFIFAGGVTFRSGPNGFPLLSDAINLEREALGDTVAINNTINANDNIPSEVELVSVSFISGSPSNSPIAVDDGVVSPTLLPTDSPMVVPTVPTVTNEAIPLDQFSLTFSGADPGAQQMQATMTSFLTPRYRAEYPNEFVDVNLSVNQDSNSSIGARQRQRRDERQVQEVFVFIFSGVVTFRSGPNGVPATNDVMNLQVVALSDTQAINATLRSNDNIPSDAVLESVTIIPSTDSPGNGSDPSTPTEVDATPSASPNQPSQIPTSGPDAGGAVPNPDGPTEESPFFGPVEAPSEMPRLAPEMPFGSPTDDGAMSESSPSIGPANFDLEPSSPSYAPDDEAGDSPSLSPTKVLARQLVSSSSLTTTALGSVIPLERFIVRVLALELPRKEEMLETMATYLTEEFHAEYPEDFVRVDLNIDGGTRTSAATRPRSQRLHARQTRDAFVFTFHGTATFKEAANVRFHGDVTTIQAVALSDPHAIQFAIKSNPIISDGVIVDSVQMIISPPTMPHGTSTQDKDIAKVSL
jgi:hypothetical protein